jgi:prophage regulatory protein
MTMFVDRIVRRRELKSIAGVSPVTAWRLEKAGDFPARVRLSRGLVGWKLSELLEWVGSRARA